jgi:hypothetical protein
MENATQLVQGTPRLAASHRTCFDGDKLVNTMLMNALSRDPVGETHTFRA